MSKQNKLVIILSLIIALLVVVGAFIYTQRDTYKCLNQCAGFCQSRVVLTPKQAGDKIISFLNEKVLKGAGVKATLDGSLTDGGKLGTIDGFYKAKVKIGDQDINFYISKSGNFALPEDFILKKDATSTKANNTNNQKEQGKADFSQLEKRDVPDIKLFVMSYCPYGLQAEKSLLPVYNLLKGKANIGIYFVYYSMHGKKEIDENLRQYCIQKEQNDKYSDYLSCFTQKGDYKVCLDQAKIDKDKLQSCVSTTDQKYNITKDFNNKDTWVSGFPKFNIETSLNNKYQIGGSPTLVINDTVIAPQQQYCPSEKNIKCFVDPNLSRSPESYKELICNSFKNPPKECSQSLSDKKVSPGFGGGTGSSSEGSCG